MNPLREAALEYDRGRLVPFIGSGMSSPVCRSWPGMIEAIEKAAGISSGAPDLAHRAERALELLLLGSGMSTSDAVGPALLGGGPGEPTPQTAALAELDWPLVVSTNYDDLYVAAVQQRELHTRRLRRPRTNLAERTEPAVRVMGRSSIDCHRVLTSLRYPALPLLWAIQGYLGGQATIRPPDGAPVLYDRWVAPHGRARPGLRAQIVVGHAEYRRVAMRSEIFRRAFGEVFRSRALLFLGSGLADRYLLDLFSQVVELYGPTPHPHFAVARQGELDVDFLRRQFGIWVHEIPSYKGLPDVIRSLRAPDRPSRRYTFSHGSRTLALATAGLPQKLARSQCVMLSGGGSAGAPRLAGWARDYLREIGLSGAQPALDRVRPHGMIWRLDTSSLDGPLVLVARARERPDSPEGQRMRPMAQTSAAIPGAVSAEAAGRLWRDVRLTRFAVREALEVARAAGSTEVISTVLASGSLRTITPSYQVIEMVRAWADVGDLDLTIHITDDVAASDLRSGRIDVEALLAADGAPDRPIEFWLEIVGPSAAISRILRVDRPARPVVELLREVGIAGDWTLTVEPAPCLEWQPWPVTRIGPKLTLEQMGILYGSTVRLARNQRSS